MEKLVPSQRHYPWGSHTLIPELLGNAPSAQPLAELWYGAHPAGPSTLNAADGARLSDVVEADPAQLGAWSSRGNGLPFLMKILAADEVLSLQAHPSQAQAEEGFARENSEGIPLDDSRRNYKDASHKPEIIVALTPFYAMAGFRPLSRTRELFAALGCAELDRYVGMLSPGEDAQTESENLRALFTTWITIPTAVRKELIDAVVAAAPHVPHGWMSGVMDTVVAINEQYPGDIGVLGALLLNHIELQPGEAIFLAAGNLHAYVRGMGVEVMANSDNVLRGGLTSKYVDVPELVKVLRFESVADPRVEALPADSGAEYPAPVEEFNVRRIEIPAADAATIECAGPAIALCTAGTVTCTRGAEDPVQLRAGEAVWLPAGSEAVTASAGENPAQVFVTWP